MYAKLVERLREYAENAWPGFDGRVSEDLKAAADALEALGGPRKEDYTKLRRGCPIWYVDFETGEIESGTVCGVHFKNGTVDSFSVDFACGDFDEFNGSALGKSFFIHKENASAALIQGESNRE